LATPIIAAEEKAVSSSYVQFLS